MAESITTPNTEDTNTQAASAGQPVEPTEPKTFTQEQVNEIVRERLARAKATPPADYEDLKAKAARLDELEEANKSELERANEAANAARSDADQWKARFEQLEAEREREAAVRSAATTYDVDVDVLMRMGGDVEENAKFLQAREAARPKFGSMSDGGEQQAPAQTLDEALAKAKNTNERIRIRAEFNARNRNK